MEEIKSIIKILESNYADWRENYLAEKIVHNEEHAELLSKLQAAMANEVLDSYDREEELETKEELKRLTSQEVVDKLWNDMSGVIKIYRGFIPVKKNTEYIIPFLNDGIRKGYMQYDDEFFDDFQCYGFESQKQMRYAVLALVNMMRAHVVRHYAKAKVVREFKRVTGIGEPYCDTYAEIYEMYFERLQRMYILEKIDNLEDLFLSQMNGDEEG